ncbi:hypothetical protein KQX54_002963 [Cotesia glomerata]|uniref:G-protein coupled receptors family 1 profile domain-containing protein n=2 Tax=Cotesia glomerata TaxID=32391 RepID=A0AAV7I6M7_COTGL|nr:hypothetical protein KQX54_002963 [Cotesia glomerata]
MTDSLLRKFPNLKFLSLERNHVCYISSDVFKNVKNLVELNVSYNKLKRLPIDLFLLSSNLSALDFSYNDLKTHTIYFTMSHSGVQCLDFSGNEIDYISHELLNYFPNLKYLNLEKNKISNISSGAFKSFAELVDLNLSGNKLRDLPDNLFNYNLRLQILNLSFNKLKYLREELFSPLTHLTTLILGFNLIQSFKFKILNSALNLRILDLDDITIEDDEENALNRFQELSIIIFKTLRYCQIYGINIRTCRPETNGVSSLSDLLSKPLLRVAVWGISVVTLVGNTLVLWGRFIYKDENRVLSIVIRNLAVADMLMGVYLLAIGLEDFNLRDMYNKEANKWISSWQCTFLGMIAMISCEVSVLILSFMSIERFIVIVIAPFNEAPSYFTCRSVTTSMIIIWIIGILLSVIPGIYWRESTRFYGLNGMCFPLHIDEAFMIGWQYSAFIFLGVNLLGLIIIGSVYLGMFISIRRIRRNTPLIHADSEIALRLFFIVLTDVLCSAPVIVLKIFTLLNVLVAPDVHAWVVVFVLPVNSAINPILYTFTVPKFRERLFKCCLRN